MKPIMHIGSCWICGRTISLDMCKVDEYGFPVHGACLTAVNDFRLQVKPAAALAPTSKTDLGKQP